MRCDEFRLRLDALEPGTELPWRMGRHLASCGPCRAEAERLESAIAAWRDEEEARISAHRESDAAVERVMASVMMTARPRRELSMGQWIFSGLFMALSGVLVPLALFYDGIGPALDDSLLFPLALVVGTGLAIFGFLFIGSHFDELSQRLERFEEDRARLRQ